MKRIIKSELDKFYTKDNLAKELISKIDIDSFDVYIDPCCGNGAFYSNVNHKYKIGIDILPHINNVIKSDFLDWDYNIIDIDKSVIAISNPPFGKQGSLALKFIKRCSEFCDKIAFILPISFMKDSMKDKIPEYFHLEYEEKLDENSFLLDDENYSVKCVFQVWSKKNIKRKKSEKIYPIGFEYTKYKDKADISVRRVGVYAGKAFLDTNKSEQSHYFLIINDKDKISLIINELNNKIWDDFTVGPRSISKNELNIVLNSL